MPKNKDGFEPGQIVEFDELIRHLNKPKAEEAEEKPKRGKRKAD